MDQVLYAVELNCDQMGNRGIITESSTTEDTPNEWPAATRSRNEQVNSAFCSLQPFSQMLVVTFVLSLSLPSVRWFLSIIYTKETTWD